MTTLGELKVGDQARVIGFSGVETNYRRKLLAMGLTPSTMVKVIRLAPLGDPMEVRVRACNISLRRDEANLLQVEVI